MATKKQLPKKAAKAAKPVKKAVAKKPAAKKAAKPAAKKPVSKKAAPAKKTVKKAASPKKVAKQAKPVSKTVSVAKKPVSPVKKSVPLKAKQAVEPVKKSAVAAPTHHEVKPAIKPLVKTVPKNEPPKKIVIPKTSTTKAVKYDPDFTKSVLDSPQQEQTGPTMRYSDAELAEFKELILRKLETAKKELAYLQGLITRKDEGGDMEDGRYMTMEDGSMSMEREQLSQMASRQITFIDHLEKAMMRIENKTYGICRVTGKLIDKARLRAVPHATLSIEAKQMMNK
ncbi:MAG TPA: TraR/DksA C4-type zinc finger protein [Flavisolibacter sp.]|jgi:RNA polymerase-binding transcription factor DksA|nr:TraR/DksA C4-type zinc finger protein [Flavisolibacter sp.]